MLRKIVADSSVDRWEDNGQIPFAAVPLKIIAGEREFIDDSSLDRREMVDYLASYKGKSGSACPGVADYLDAFGEAEEVFCFAITSRLSGSYNAARLAKEDYEQANPGRRVFVMDSLSAGPEIRLLMERAEEDLLQGMDFTAVCRDLERYQKQTSLLFCLESLRNLANNGRVSPVVAKVAGVLGIRLVGRASADGVLEPLDKCRGEKKALQTVLEELLDAGYEGGKLRIDHCDNPAGAESMAGSVRALYPEADITIRETGGLCSFYAEHGGLLIGFET